MSLTPHIFPKVGAFPSMRRKVPHRDAIGLWLMAVALVTTLLAAGSAAAQTRLGTGPSPDTVQEVGVITATETDVPQIVTLPGRAVAYEAASVRPRIGGVIDAIDFKAGDFLEAGAPMFRLEIDTLDVALAAAEASVAGARAARQSAQATVTRYQTLEGRGVSRADLEAAEVDLQRAEADLSRAEADLQSARLERQRATITAPISGVASRTTATIGSLVTANQSEALATVTRLDPIYVDAGVASAGILEARRRIAEGVMTPQEPPGIALILGGGERHATDGKIVDSGTTVSTSTGTVDLRIEIPNPDRLILPGQFLRVEMTLGTIRAILVPQRATSRLADGSLSVHLARDGRARRVTLATLGAWNNAWVVTDGISPGDQVIVDGLSNLQDGTMIDPVPVTLDERGVVTDIPTPEGAADSAVEGRAAPVVGRRGAPEPDQASASLPGENSARSTAAAETEADTSPQAGGWLSRIRPWLGLAPDETLGEGAGRRWERLRALVGMNPRTTG